MDWKALLASITGSVDQELLLRNEYLVTENRMLRHQITGRVRLSDGERKILTEIGKQIIDAAGVKRVPLPPRSPNLNAYAERCVRSVKEEALSRLILFGEGSLRHALNEYMDHYHHERKHQGKGNVLLFPMPSAAARRTGPMCCRERLGGLLRYYTREAA
jgi:putative transposase